AQALIDGLDGGYLAANALIIIEAGELSPRSGLRKLFEKAKRAVSLPCYVDGPEDVRRLAVAMASQEDLRFDEDALALAVSLLGDDRGVSRAELEKLILYKGLKGQRSAPETITLEDVRLMLVDGVGDVLDEAAAAAADGAPPALSRALFRSASAGASAIGFLRALQRSFMRLHTAQTFIAQGASPADAMKKLKPPVFFAEQKAFQHRLRRWPLARLETALDALVEAELAAKTTGAPQAEIIERTALRLSVMGGS
ncbi:MAG: DNA polymerase III subunit delta, partial [Pseudomonadota bacterium]